MAKDAQKTTKKTKQSDEQQVQASHDHADHDHTHGHDHDHADSLIAANTIITITIPQAEAQAAYKKARNKLSKIVKSDGFRKGKTPPRLAEAMVGPDKIIQEALEMLVPARYTEEVKKQNKKPLTQPEFAAKEISPDKDWVVEAHIAEKPEFDIKNYKDIAKKAKKKGQEEAKQRIEELKKNQAKAKEEGKSESTSTQDELVAYEKDLVLQSIYQALVLEIKPRIAELLVKEETRHDLQQLADRLKAYQIGLEDYIKQQGMTFEQLSQQLTTSALGKLQLLFITNAIAEEAKIEVTDADIEASFDKVQSDQTLQQYRQHPYYRGLIKQTLLREKVAEHLLQ